MRKCWLVSPRCWIKFFPSWVICKSQRLVWLLSLVTCQWFAWQSIDCKFLTLWLCWVETHKLWLGIWWTSTVHWLRSWLIKQFIGAFNTTYLFVLFLEHFAWLTHLLVSNVHACAGIEVQEWSFVMAGFRSKDQGRAIIDALIWYATMNTASLHAFLSRLVQVAACPEE